MRHLCKITQSVILSDTDKTCRLIELAFNRKFRAFLSEATDYSVELKDLYFDKKKRVIINIIFLIDVSL